MLANINSHENFDEAPDVDPRGDDLHNRFCGRESQLQEERKKLPDER
jgi:hypothetical protein